jgi:hypothetical protein
MVDEDGHVKRQLPDGLDLGSIPCLVSTSDQGPNNVAALNFCMFSNQTLLFWSTWDPFHRCWNDIKSSFKKSLAPAWRCVLEMALVCNLNYGPFGSSTWFYKKRTKMEHFLLTCPHTSSHWMQYQHLICMERRVPEPSNAEESQLIGFNGIS